MKQLCDCLTCGFYLCVTIGQCCLYVMGHSRWGYVFRVLWATVGGVRLFINLVLLQETAAGLVASSCGDK